jgi:nicotinic acid mononucleotide adenylyltransferase
MELTPTRWQQRYTAACDTVLESERLLEIRARLAGADIPRRASVATLAGGATLGRAARVAVFAGSFNPLTVAHTAVAVAAHAMLVLDSFVWAFARVTVDKERVERATLVDRIAQLEAYVQDAARDDALAVLDAGLYADQAEAFRALLAPSAELWLLVGFDKIVQIFDPHYYDDRDAALRRLFAAAGLLVAPRAGHGQPDLAALLAAPENHAYANRVRYLPLPASLGAVSSTAARADLASASTADPVTLATFLTPEGAALAQATAAYAPPETLSNGEVVDRYWLRGAWLNALAAVPFGERPGVSLAQLVDRSAAPTTAGAAIRRWLRGERWPGGPANLPDLLARHD